MAKINLLFVVPSLWLGGAEKQAVAIANGLSKEGYNIHFFTFEKRLDQLEDLNTKKIKFYNQPRRYKFDIAPSRKIAAIINIEKIDIIYSSLQIAFIYGFIGRIMAKRKPKLIVSMHSTIGRSLKEGFFDRFLYAPFLIKCDKIVTVCDNQKKFLSHKYPFLENKFITIYNGIDTEKFKDDISADEKKKLTDALGVKNDELVIGMVAGFRSEKGHEYALKAIKILLDSGIKLKFILVGDGDRKHYLQSLAKNLNISQHIIWLGFQKEPKIYISIFDIFLLTSIKVETFSVAALEALSMSKPVISTDVGGVSEMVLNGVNGYLVMLKNPEEIAEKIKYLAENHDVLERLSENARRSIVDNFDINQTIRKTEMLFEEVGKESS